MIIHLAGGVEEFEDCMRMFMIYNGASNTNMAFVIFNFGLMDPKLRQGSKSTFAGILSGNLTCLYFSYALELRNPVPGSLLLSCYSYQKDCPVARTQDCIHMQHQK